MRYLLGEIPDTWYRINIIIAITFGIIITLPGIVIMYNEMIHNNFVLIHDMNEHIHIISFTSGVPISYIQFPFPLQREPVSVSFDTRGLFLDRVFFSGVDFRLDTFLLKISGEEGQTC